MLDALPQAVPGTERAATSHHQRLVRPSALAPSLNWVFDVKDNAVWTTWRYLPPFVHAWRSIHYQVVNGMRVRPTQLRSAMEGVVMTII